MTNKSTPTRIAIVGTGGMANNHAAAYKLNPDVIIVAGLDMDEALLQKFCDEHDIEHRFTSLDDLLAWGEFDAVSNVTPDKVHYGTTMQILAAQKHVLCEKPLATSYPEAQEMADLAQKMGVVNMVNLSYRDVAAVQKAAQMVAEGAIGEVKHFEASYLQSWLTQPAWGDWKTESQWLWRLSSEHGSKGVLGDVGIHIIDFATYIAGQMPKDMDCKLHTFDKAPNNQIGEYPLDANDSFVMHMQLENNALGTISATRFASGHHNDLRLRIYGDKGGLEVLFEKKISRLNACLGEGLDTETWHEVETPDVETVYQKFVKSIREQKSLEPTFARGAALQKILDQALGDHK
ncbi:MAG: Gfo/Idh/MocA family oxidoreductase [Alphaproteobacteria bacterium]|nr:Gfo/Idh/MocA family oxidoreductase [Alphaproteobacteria bacterium]